MMNSELDGYAAYATRLAFVLAMGLLASSGCGSSVDLPDTENRVEPSETQTGRTETSPGPPPPQPVPPDPAQLQEEALTALDSGDSDTALRLARRAFRASPDDPQMIFMMARVLAERNRFAEAIRMLDELAAAAPETRLPGLGQTAEWLVLQGRWDEAEKRFRRLLEEVGEATVVDRMLSQLLLRQGRRLEAGGHLRQLCRAGEASEFELRALLQGLHPLAAEPMTDGEFEPIGALGRARYEISQGNWQNALDQLEQSTDRQAAEAGLRARIYAHQQNFVSLNQWLDEMPASAMETTDGWFARGVSHAKRDSHHEALRCFGQVVLRDPTDGQAYESISRSLRALGLSSEADIALQRARIIRQSQTIGNELAEGGPETAKLASLADRLDQLHRPLEALSWRGVAVYYRLTSGDLPDSEARERIGEINRQRLRLVSEGETGATQDFLWCGVDLDALPRKHDDDE